MGQEIASAHFSEGDFEHFAERLREETHLLDEAFANETLSPHDGIGGFELEAWLVDGELRPAPRNADLLARVDAERAVHELARFNVELNGSPRALAGTGLSAMAADLQRTWAQCDEEARGLGMRMAMVGILPSARETEFSLANMSPLKRYEALNEQVLRLRGGRPLQLDIQGRDSLRIEHANLMLESATTSFQIHLQVSPRSAARFYNAAKIASAPLVAIAANSPYLFGLDLWDETRIPLFEQAVSVEGPGSPPRVSFGTHYLERSLAESFHRNRDDYPVLLPEIIEAAPAEFAHLRLHNGTIWRWNRPLIGFEADGTPHLRIEHRVVPAGPTVLDCIANAALYFGLVKALGSREPPPERLLDHATASRNFYVAARHGLAARIRWLNGREVEVGALLEGELMALAAEGLARLDVAADDARTYLGIIAGRLATGLTGAAWQRRYVQRHGAGMQNLAAAYLERQASGSPVHEWDL